MTTLVLGAGLAGLGAAIELGRRDEQFLVVEREAEPGGLARTREVGGFTFDQTGHFLHFKSTAFRDDLEAHGVELDQHERHAAVVLGSTVVPYPVQYNLWALPEGERRAVVASLQRDRPASSAPSNFDELVVAAWGEELAERFFRPYNEKLWGRPLRELPSDCAGSYLPHTDLELVEKSCSVHQEYRGYNAHFFYPRAARIDEVAWRLAEPLGGRLRCGFEVTALDLETRTARGRCGTSLSFDRLISTLPLPALLRMLGRDGLPPERFAHTTVWNVRVGFRGTMRLPHHWLYVPDRAMPFFRLGFPANVHGATCPEGCASLSIECGVPRDDVRPARDRVVRAAVDYVVGLGAAEIDEVLVVDDLELSPAYVVHRSPGREDFEAIRSQLESEGVHLAGRFGTWDYFSMEDAYLSGRSAVDVALSAQQAGLSQGLSRRAL